MSVLLHLNPVFWLIIVYCCGSGVEWLSSIRRFRKLQSNYPRFTYLVPEDKEVSWILGWSFLLMIVSVVMTFVNIIIHVKDGMFTEIYITLGFMPIMMCLMIIGDNVNSGRQIISWKSLVLLGTLVMEIGSIGTTLCFYLGLSASNIKTASELISCVTELTIANVVSLLAAFVFAIILAVITKDCAQDPIKGALKTHLKWLSVFNPVLSPITIPLAIVIFPTFLIGRWIIRKVSKIKIEFRNRGLVT